MYHTEILIFVTQVQFFLADLFANPGAVCFTAVMNGNMLTFALLGFLLVWMLPADRPLSGPIPLSMVEDAVDDMYAGCTDHMMRRVKDKFMKIETSAMFGKAWQSAENCANEKLRHQDKNGILTKDHIQAICLYTSDYMIDSNQMFYELFNTVTRTGRKKYTTSFEFHAFHFLLTSAVQTLKNSQSTIKPTYRRTHSVFTGKVNTIMRFGSFTSSSFSTDLKHFGNKSCFEIWTNLGASLGKYSVFDDEDEVLIPPYEMFKITKKVKDAPSCEVTYTLRSNLNCVYNRESNTLHPISAVPVDGFLLIIIISSIAIVSLMLTLVIVKVLENRKETAAYSVSSMHSAPYSSGVVI
uniref:NAD(P)(+)--arginine ADP-ribosyltransferase n=1 Tax=Myripristis murdjan TaxID=586833 RepID=A0A668ACY6_9TELE